MNPAQARCLHSAIAAMQLCWNPERARERAIRLQQSIGDRSSLSSGGAENENRVLAIGRETLVLNKSHPYIRIMCSRKTAHFSALGTRMIPLNEESDVGTARGSENDRPFRPIPSNGICSLLSDKWIVPVLWRLSLAEDHRLRFSELKKRSVKSPSAC